MNIRFAASLLFIGALAYACGPRTRAEPTLETAAVVHTVAQQGSSAAPLAPVASSSSDAREKTLKAPRLAARLNVVQGDADVRFALTVTNKSGKQVEVQFPSGQAYDFVVLDSIGREVWRWADGHIFTQSVQNKLLAKGEAMAVAERWNGARAGKFVAVARLRSSNFPIEERMEFVRREPTMTRVGSSHP